MNLALMIEDVAPDRTAMVARGHVTTYGDLADQVAHVRGGLDSLGLTAGDRLAIVCANNRFFVTTYLAALGCGLVVVPLNPASPSPELADQLRRSMARACVVGPAGAGSIADIDRSTLPDLEMVIDCGGTGLRNAHSLDELLDAAPTPIVEVEPDDLAALMFTSGTAGAPKAAMLTHRNLAASVVQLDGLASGRLTPDDVMYGLLPFFHIFGLSAVLNYTLSAGATLIAAERFDPLTTAEEVAAFGVTVLPGPPTMWAALAALPAAEAANFTTVRLGVSGASALGEATFVAARDNLGIEIIEGYGLTESAATVTSTLGGPPRPGSIGRPFEGVDVRLVDDDGDDVLVGDRGEIWLQGANVFAGYWNDPEATGTALTADGWLRTGDIAIVDDEGYLYLVDRSKDLIIVSGFNVFPAEVEAVLERHPAIERAGVVGVAHPYTGEAVKAYVIASEGQPVEEDAIVEFCCEHLARYKAPNKIEFVSELPETVGGKLQRRRLRDEQ